METDTAEQLNAIGDTASATVRQVALSHLVTQYVQNVSDEFLMGVWVQKCDFRLLLLFLYVFLFLIFCFFHIIRFFLFACSGDLCVQ